MKSEYIPTQRKASKEEYEVPDFTLEDQCLVMTALTFFLHRCMTIEDLNAYWKENEGALLKVGIEKETREWWQVFDAFAARKKELST